VSDGHFGTSAKRYWVRSVLRPKCLDTVYIEYQRIDVHGGVYTQWRTVYVHVVGNIVDCLYVHAVVYMASVNKNHPTAMTYATGHAHC